MFQALFVVEEVLDLQREWRIGRDMSTGEVGSGIRTTKKASSFIVSSSSFLGSFKGTEPHSNLLCCVLDLRHPFPRWPLSHPNKLAFGIAVAATPLLELALFVG